MAEQYTNFGQSTLATAYAPGNSTLTLVSAASFPSFGTFTVNLEDQMFTVTGVSGDVLTVTPEFGSDVAHPINTPVVEVLSKRALDQIKADITGSISGDTAGTANTLAKRDASGRLTSASMKGVGDQTFNVDSDTHQLIAAGSNLNKRVVVGYDTTSNYGYLQSQNRGVTGSPLCIQPAGGGKVLVGTTSDAGNGAYLQVNGSVSASSFIGALSGNATTATNASNLSVAGSGSSTFYAGGVSKLVIRDFGSVTDVFHDNVTSGIRLFAGDIIAQSGAAVQLFGENYTPHPPNNGCMFLDTGTLGNMYFRTAANGTISTRMMLRANGFFGVGSINAMVNSEPNAALEVYSTDTTAAHIWFWAHCASGGGIKASNANGVTVTIDTCYFDITGFGNVPVRVNTQNQWMRQPLAASQPADSDIANKSAIFYLNGNTLRVRYKNASGTVYDQLV